MKVYDKNNGVLILRGQSWLMFACLILFACATPVFVWITIQLEQWEAMIVAGLAPVLIAAAYWRQYENWQLVLEADYGIGTLYSGRWLNRQDPWQFDLSKLEKASVVSQDVKYRDGKLRERSVTEHYLKLDITGQHVPLTVGIGRYTHIRRLVWSTNNWLERNRARIPHAMPKEN